MRRRSIAVGGEEVVRDEEHLLLVATEDERIGQEEAVGVSLGVGDGCRETCGAEGFLPLVYAYETRLFFGVIAA